MPGQMIDERADVRCPAQPFGINDPKAWRGIDQGWVIERKPSPERYVGLAPTKICPEAVDIHGNAYRWAQASELGDSCLGDLCSQTEVVQLVARNIARALPDGGYEFMTQNMTPGWQGLLIVTGDQLTTRPTTKPDGFFGSHDLAAFAEDAEREGWSADMAWLHVVN